MKKKSVIVIRVKKINNIIERERERREKRNVEKEKLISLNFSMAFIEVRILFPINLKKTTNL